MSSFMAIPLKRTSDVDMTKPLNQLISTYYGGEETYTDSVNQLDKLRKDSTFKGIEGKSATTLTALQRYYDQLKSFAAKCPINEVPINFKWKDAFDKSGYSLFSSGSSLIIQSLAYERVCVLFNLAASYSDIAATALNEDVHNEHALQLAAKNFQIASGIFMALKTDAPASLGQRSTQNDLNPSILEILHYLMLAQAQEAIFVKATQNNMSDASLARVASQCSEYYNECYKLIQIVKSMWPEKDWFNQIHAKHLIYNAISDFHQAACTSEAKKFGEEIAWLNHAVELFKQAETKSILSEFLQTYHKKAIKRQEDAIKENDFIYHARVPEHRLLDSVERFSLVKPAPVPVKFLPESDLFQGLLPLRVQQAWQKLEARKQEIIGQEVAGLQEASSTLNAVLASLNLPAALEDAPGVELPQSLQDKSKYVRQKGGIQYVSKLIHELPDLLKRNNEILNEIEQSIKNEEQRDSLQREKFGKAKWTRTPSSTLNKAWEDYVEKYRNILKNAVTADEKVKEKFRNHEQEIALLSNENKRAIADAIPSGYQGHSYSNAPCAQRLRQLMQDFANLKSSREELENKFKGADFESLKNRFIETVNNEGSFDDTAMIAESLGSIFGPLQKESRESKERQEVLIKEVRVTNEDFVELKGGSQSAASERDRFFSRLAAAHDAFNDLLRHLQEGTKFYNDLTQLLVSLQTKVDDYCFARKTELEELSKTLDPSGSKSTPSQSSAPAASDYNSSQPASAPAAAPQAPNYMPYYPPPPLPSMPYSAYNTYHPGQGYPMPQTNYYAGYPTPPQGYPPYPSGYHTLPSQHPPSSGQQPPSS